MRPKQTEPAAQDTLPGEADFDLVEAAFVEGFARASDPTSFLRLAGVPFEVDDPQGGRLMLLRVESGASTDIGLVTPGLGGERHRYAPLPAKLVSTRPSLALVYCDGAAWCR